MVRLPPKKSKQKQVVIDYTSVESAKSSAPSDYDHESWLEEGIKQEEQGERYQFGAKTTRHYTNAVVCFSIAASLDSTDFDSRYNAARVLYRLAMDHLPPTEAYDALGKAIIGYRESVQVGESLVMAKIDGLFNLAQACVALFEMVDEAAIAGVAPGTGLEAAKEAKELFVQVESLQRIEMEKVFGSGSVGDDQEGDEVGEEEEGGSEGTEAVKATETVIVTPRLLLDTLLESISLDMSLHSSLVDDPTSQAQLLESAKATFERAVSLRTTYLSDASSEVDVEMALAQFSIYSAPSSPQATQVLEQVLSSTPTLSPSLLSIYADHLVESLPLSQPFETVAPQLERTLSTYQQVQALLSNRLSPPKDVPSYQIPLLLSSNLLAQSTVQLLSHHIVSASPNPTSASNHLVQAHSLALDSISILKSGLSLSPSSTSSNLALIRAPPSQEPLSNLSTLLALRSSYFSLIRIRLRSADSNEKLEEEKKRFWPVWYALTRDLRKDERVREGDLRWWIDEIEEDKIAECVGGERAKKEMEWWMSLL
ncbi:uncharacterized protein JCM6883_003026 [Sporobolomyces salmoneus]|uniref:uncharacterized protein n=1 Tax=Sporobolomyces salmoneus TaxID=183962 RepID=UPI003172FF14